MGLASTGDDIGGPSVDLSIITEPHIVTRRVRCSQAAQSYFFLLTGPKTLLSDSQWLHSDHRLVRTIWRPKKAYHTSLTFIHSYHHC
jgi:hypothetical protein